MAVDNAPKYPVEIVAWDGSKVRSFSGEPSMRKLEFDSRIFQVTEVTSPGPPYLAISLRPEFVTALSLLPTLLGRVVATASGVALKNSAGNTVFEVGLDGSNALGFFGTAIQPRVNVGPTPTAQDIADDLAAKGLLQAS